MPFKVCALCLVVQFEPRWYEQNSCTSAQGSLLQQGMEKVVGRQPYPIFYREVDSCDSNKRTTQQCWNEQHLLHARFEAGKRGQYLKYFWKQYRTYLSMYSKSVAVWHGHDTLEVFVLLSWYHWSENPQQEVVILTRLF